jgi:uncharacterized damage-inducible protein DinB
MSVCAHFAQMARNNAWSNRRLHAACARLTQAELEAPRTSFFPSLQETLNHILLVDLFYIDALEAGGEGLAIFAQPLPFPTMAELVPAQRAADERLVRFCASLEASVLARAVEIDRGDEGISRESVEATLAHLFVHQIHHRGQTHAMLSGTRVPPPQLDEFFLEYDRARRAGEEIP